MLPQPSPNYFSCLPTAFAIALDTPVRELMAELGFDGTAIIFDDVEEPECRRAWHFQDFIKPCLSRGYAPILIEAIPSVLVNGEDRTLPMPQSPLERLTEFMHAYKGVLMGTTGQGKRHAIGWQDPYFYNTDGTQSEDTDLEISEFIALIKRGE